MTTQRTYPNIFWIGFTTSISLFLYWFSVSMVAGFVGLQIPFLLPNTGEASTPELSTIILLTVLVLSMILMGTYNLWKVSNAWINISVDESCLTMVKPLRVSKKSFDWSDLRGFSTSQYFVGGDWDKLGDLLFASDSVIVYPTDDEPFEIVKLYNFRFGKFKQALMEQGVQEYDFEPHRTEGFFLKRRTFETKQKRLPTKPKAN